MPNGPMLAGFITAALVILLIPGPAGAPVPQQVLFLGLLYVAMALVTDGLYVVLASSLREWLGGRMMRGPLPQYASGAIYIGLGVTTALSGRRT